MCALDAALAGPGAGGGQDQGRAVGHALPAGRPTWIRCEKVTGKLCVGNELWETKSPTPEPHSHSAPNNHGPTCCIHTILQKYRNRLTKDSSYTVFCDFYFVVGGTKLQAV